MPTTDEILNNLKAIANDYSIIAIIWHVLLYAALIAIIAKWGPTNKQIGLLICLLLTSVAILAWINGNPFNGALFTIVTALCLILILRTSPNILSYSQVPFIVSGILMVTFALVYPHFVDTESYFSYLYQSPVGLIPCPTLSLIIGLLLIYNGFGSTPILIVFIIFGFFYGLFGVFKLGVLLDLFLVFGTSALLLKYILSLRIPVA